MSKPLLGILLGGILGIFDGLSALVSAPAGLILGGLVGLFFAFLVCLGNRSAGLPPYWVEVMLPGSLVGLIVGYATQRYGRSGPATA